jgi:hypothetical protein
VKAFRAAAQQPHNFGSIIKGAQAFVFLSCPHRVEDDDPADTLNRYNRILKSFNKLPARSKHQTNSDAEEAQVLIDNAIGFESLCSQTPVFSLYDGLAMRTFRIGKAPKVQATDPCLSHQIAYILKSLSMRLLQKHTHTLRHCSK